MCGEGKKVNSPVEVGEGRRTHHNLSREVGVLPEGRGGRARSFRGWERAVAAPTLIPYRLE